MVRRGIVHNDGDEDTELKRGFPHNDDDNAYDDHTEL